MTILVSQLYWNPHFILLQIHEYIQLTKAQSQGDNLPYIVTVPTTQYLKDVRQSMTTLGRKLVALGGSDATKEAEGKVRIE